MSGACPATEEKRPCRPSRIPGKPKPHNVFSRRRATSSSPFAPFAATPKHPRRASSTRRRCRGSIARSTSSPALRRGSIRRSGCARASATEAAAPSAFAAHGPPARRSPPRRCGGEATVCRAPAVAAFAPRTSPAKTRRPACESRRMPASITIAPHGRHPARTRRRAFSAMIRCVRERGGPPASPRTAVDLEPSIVNAPSTAAARRASRMRPARTAHART